MKKREQREKLEQNREYGIGQISGVKQAPPPPRTVIWRMVVQHPSGLSFETVDTYNECLAWLMRLFAFIMQDYPDGSNSSAAAPLLRILYFYRLNP